MQLNWKEYYDSRTVTHQEAASHLQNGWRIFMEVGNKSNTQAMYNAIIDRALELDDFMLCESLAMMPHKLWNPDYNLEVFDKIKVTTGYAMPGPTRGLCAQKYRDVILSQADDSHTYMSKIIDAYCCMTTPPNKDGFVNLSLCDFIHMTAIREGRKVGKLQLVITEINDQLPVVFGDNWMHVSEFDYFVPSSAPILAFSRGAEVVISDEERSIANYVAENIFDGDCIQIGLGTIPEAVGKLLDGRHNLGLHTELMVDGHLDMIRKGIVTNTKKELFNGVTVASFAIGSQDLYDFCTENPAFSLMPGSLLTDPKVICQNSNVKAINNTLLVDLSGQSACDTIGNRQISGIGGQFNFQQGARWSPGGRAFSLLNATRTLPSGEKVSAIVPDMPLGTKIAVIRHFADLYVTEFGIADLRHKFQRDRADALIAIAHPDFRGELRKAAFTTLYPAAWVEKQTI